MSKLSLEELFTSGQFQDVLTLYRKGDAGKAPQEKIYIIGSFAFLGDWQLTQQLATEWREGMSVDQEAAILHYCSFALMRASRYEECRKTLIKFSRWLRNQKTPKKSMAFYFHAHSLAFFYFYTGRYSLSQKRAQKAIHIALQLRYSFGEAMSHDLFGHAQIQDGHIHSGLKSLSKAKNICVAMGYTSFADSMKLTILQTKAFYGLAPQSILKELQTSIKQLSPSNIFTKSELLLELSRQFFLRGAFQQSEKVLEDAAAKILKNQNRRQMAKLNFAIARISFLKGDRLNTLSQLHAAKNYLNRDVDFALLAIADGMLQKLDPQPAQFNLCLELYKKSRSALQFRHLKRLNPLVFIPGSHHSFQKGEDPIGDLFDEMSTGSTRALQTALSLGYYGLLFYFFNIKTNERVLVANENKTLFWLIESAAARPLDLGTSKILRTILLSLMEGPKTKLQLCSEVWGKQYHPLNSDPAFFKAMNRLKSAVNLYSENLIFDSHQYRLSANLRVSHPFYIEALPAPAKGNPSSNESRNDFSPTPAFQVLPKKLSIFQTLTHRQQKALKLIETQGEVSAPEFASTCKITRMTAYRDLQSLVSLGLLTSHGRARQTRYRLRS